MKDGFTMVDECGDIIPRIHIPNPDRAVTRAGNDDPLVILQAQHRPSMPSQDSLASQGVPVPHLDGVVPQAGDDFGIVVL
jgi:hypothetical protein